MSKYVVLYNPFSANGTGAAKAEELKETLSEHELRFENITKIGDLKAYFDALPEDENPVIAGGDGTLWYLVNFVDCDHDLNRDIYYMPCGSGNDFYCDVKEQETELPFVVNKYLKDLPIVTVKGKDYKVLNGVGFGIDGYCCEEADKMKKVSDKPVNYTSIAIKGMLYDYKPTNAAITVDGIEYTFRKAWLVPTMNGRYYGGGMNAAPNQDRLNEKGTLSTMLFHGSGRIPTLITFPNIFKGTHVNAKCVTVLTGRDITVTFDRPTALQIDGETFLGVTTYRMRSVKG